MGRDDHGDTGSLESTEPVALTSEILINLSSIITVLVIVCFGNSSNIRKKRSYEG